jgi:Protein of unknown function (DUF2510)
MTTLDDAAAPDGGAGWYPDPLGSANDRYWDGTAWTDRIQKATNTVSATGTESSSSLPTPTVPATGGPARETGVSGWVRRRPRIVFWSTLGIALIVGIGLGGLTNDKSEVNEKNDEISSLQRQLADSEEAQEDAEAEAAKVSDRRAQIIASAESKAASIIGSSKSEAQKAEASLNSLQGEVASTEKQLAGVEGSLGGAEEEAAKSTISDGTWQAEVDYIPGTYEAEGGASCYWAEESEPGGGTGVEGIIENGGFNKHQILSITSPYFETRGCGTWKRVGE